MPRNNTRVIWGGGATVLRGLGSIYSHVTFRQWPAESLLFRGGLITFAGLTRRSFVLLR